MRRGRLTMGDEGPVEPPATILDLLDRPLTAHLCTLGRDGAPSVQPINYVWDGACLYVSTKTTRQKYRNIVRDPRVALSIQDPDDPLHYVEIRGRVTRIEPDPTEERSTAIRVRYGGDGSPSDPPEPDIVIIEITPIRFGTFRARWQ